MLMCILAQQKTSYFSMKYLGFKPNHPTWALFSPFEDSDKESYSQ